VLSLVAVYLEGRPPSATKTYGYRRAGVLVALVNALSLIAVSFFIFYEASGAGEIRSTSCRNNDRRCAAASHERRGLHYCLAIRARRECPQRFPA